jgi:HAD superfamily hydrolase (TIGR01509 family)
MFELLSTKHEFFREFSGGVVSSAEKLLKPQPEIYQVLIERYGLNPKETLFIDDLLPNIEGAAAAGFQTLHLEDHRNLRSELAALFPDLISGK